MTDSKRAPVDAPSTAPLPAAQAADLQGLIDQFPHGVLLMDCNDSRLLLINREAERLLVLRRAQSLGRPAASVLEPGLAALCEPSRWRALESGRRNGREDLRLTTAFGVRWLHVQRSLLSWSGLSRPLGMVNLQDANARRQLERALQESDARFREVTEAVRECLFVTTPEWDRLLFSSPLLLDTLGVSPMELHQGPALFEQRVVAEDRALYARRLALQAEGRSADMVLRIQHPDKGLRWLRLRSRLNSHGRGEALVYGILADVSEEQERHRELLRARDRAEAASRAKSEFMANMSHEIRTPMNGVLGMAQLLLDERLDEAQQARVQTMLDCADAMMQLLDDVLDFANDEAPPAPAMDRAFQPAQLLEECLGPLRKRAATRGLRLEQSLQPGLPVELLGHAAGLRRALGKLLDNALKFTERGRVSLSLERDGEAWLLCRVRDSGIGIPAEQLPLLFKPFTQLEAKLSRRYGGAGLGLAIAQRLAQRMGGSLSVQSQLHQGSEFQLRVPLRVAQATSADVRPAPEKPPYLTHRVLVVEDNPVNQEVIRQMLERLGCEVRIAPDGPAGLKALGDERFDLVMMDIHMPGMDGMEALQRFRQADARTLATPASTPVLAVTANALAGDEQKLLSHGFDDYLAKPLHQARLQALLRRHLRAKDAPQETPSEGAAMSSDPHSTGALADCLDAEALARLRELDPGGKNQLLQRVIGAYLKSLDKLLPDLAQARAAGMDLAAIRHVAHTLKSSSASLGALRLSQLCADIEAQARKGQAEGLDKLLDAMHDELRHVEQALSALLNGPQ